MKTIGVVYEMTSNPYFGNTGSEYTDRISEYVYPSEINDICQAICAIGENYKIIDGPQGLIDSVNSKEKIDLIFNKSIGFKGLERKIAVPAICQIYNLPRLGTGAYAMTLCRHKFHTNRLLHGLGFHVPFAFLYQINNPMPSIPCFPVIVKPNEESDSLGITEESICYSYGDLERRIQKLYENFQQDLIIEEFIPGEEWKVAVIGNGSDAKACGCVNSMKNGHSMNGTLQTRDDIVQNTLYFVPVNHPLKDKALDTAVCIHRILNLNDYSRCDFRLGSDGCLYCMEVSTHPEISHRSSSFIEAAKLTYSTYNKVIHEIISSAYERYD